MSPTTNLPSRALVERARDELLEHALATGTRPSVLDLARRVGLANTTLRRNYPDIAQTITAVRAAGPTSSQTPYTPRDTTGWPPATPSYAGPTAN